MMESTTLCFVCLKAILTKYGKGHDCRGEENQEVTGKSRSGSSVKILISFILNSSGRRSDSGRDKLQNDILSSLEKRKLSICPECLLKAELLLKLHLELEKIQMQILDLLRKLQHDFTKKDSEVQDNISCEDEDRDIFRFRDALLQNFTCHKLSDKALVRLERLNIAGFGNSSAQTLLPPEEERECPDNFDSISRKRNDLESVPETHPFSTSPVKHELEAVSDPDGNEQACSVSENDVVSPLEEHDDDYEYEDTIAVTSTRKSLKRKVKQRKFEKVRRSKKKSAKPKLETSSSGSDNEPESNDDQDNEMKTTPHPPPLIKPKKTGCWDCDICLEYIPHEDFQFHLKSHPELEKIYTCVLCPPDLVGRAPKRFYGTYKGLVWHYIRCSHHVQLPCKLCPDPEQNILYPKSRLCKHLYEVHYPNSSHKKLPCKYSNCAKEFYDPRSLSSHYTRQHDGAGDISCSICQKKMTTREGLMVHIKRKHPQGSSQFYCSSCPKVFNFRKDLRSHERNYHENPLVECPHCSKMLRVGTALRMHIKTVHGEKQYQCQFCSREFTQLSNLKTHEETHATEKKFLCEHCPYAGTTQKSLRSHMVAVHEKKIFKCEHCPKAFSTKSLLHHHQNSHSKEKPYKCEICGAGFTYGTGRSGHLRKVHGAKSVNGKVIVGALEVQTQRRRKGQKNKKETEAAFPCEYCPKKFQLKISWEDHQRIHTGDENYKCEVCQEEFVNQRMRYIHRKEVHGIRRANKKKAVTGVADATKIKEEK